MTIVYEKEKLILVDCKFKLPLSLYYINICTIAVNIWNQKIKKILKEGITTGWQIILSN